MFEAVDWTQVVACAPRPEASWGHGMAMVAFVLAAWWRAPRDLSIPVSRMRRASRRELLRAAECGEGGVRKRDA
jgi:hypothetical protein